MEYKDAANLKDEIPTETLLMALILMQQKMINQLLEKYADKQKQITNFLDPELE